MRPIGSRRTLTCGGGRAGVALWRHYDVHMTGWDEFVARGLLRSVATSRSEEAYYRVTYDRVRSGETDTWDYQWQFACWAQSGLAVVPRTSLVENVGFRPDATHTALDPTRGFTTADLGELVHPSWVVRDRKADAAAFRELFAAGTLKQRMFNRSWLALWTVIPHEWRR